MRAIRVGELALFLVAFVVSASAQPQTLSRMRNLIFPGRWEANRRIETYRVFPRNERKMAIQWAE
jgi:hypothetical protein